MSQHSTASAVVPFAYGDTQVRTVVVDGEPWFVAADVARILGYRMASDMTRRLDAEDRGTRPVRTPSGEQDMTTINEPGLYQAVLGSQTAGARDFKRWVTHTVLPEIRKTGSFNARPELAGAELVAAAFIESQKILEQREARIHQLEQVVTEQAPKVTYVDTYVADADLLSFSTVASTNGITEKALRNLLIERDWIYSQTDSRWSESKQKKTIRNRYSEKASHKRHFRRVETHEAPRFRGSEVMHTLKITPQGAEAIARLIARAA
ncbi:BRO family protein [Gordonia sp. 4N]|uniref:BRO family protein n=1 Tax=Gordonia sp. 4N TaxID=2993508 RepID=UPI002248D28F|nr:BRO family protein [Gordonia sp. 4N]MCX2753120.1 BRO family protein [Gordonia sp. 4N]